MAQATQKNASLIFSDFFPQNGSPKELKKKAETYVLYAKHCRKIQPCEFAKRQAQNSTKNTEATRQQNQNPRQPRQQNQLILASQHGPRVWLVKSFLQKYQCV
jgi:hypothetical protein